MVSQIQSVTCCLQTLEQRDNTGKVLVSIIPDDIGKTFVELFQTSSNKKFNNLFRLRELKVFEAAIMEGDKSYSAVKDILDYAHSADTTISASKERWTGQFYKINKTGFCARGGINPGSHPCFNCK